MEERKEEIPEIISRLEETSREIVEADGGATETVIEASSRRNEGTRAYKEVLF